MSSEPTTQTATFRLSPQQAFLLGRGSEVSQCVIDLGPAVTQDDVRARLADLVARHESLRTTFVTPPGARAAVAQTIHDRLDAEFQVLEGADVDRVLAEEAASVDVERGPGLRVAWLDRARLVLTAPAAAADAPSLALVARELAGEAAGGADPIQHADYAEWRHELATGDDPAAAQGRAFWSSATEGMTRGTLLFGRAGDGAPGPVGRVPIALGPERTTRLEECAASLRATSEVVLDAAWHALIARLSSATELLTAELLDGRSEELEDAVGPYVQVVPVRIAVSSDTRFVELVDRLARARAEAARWRDYAQEADLARLSERACAGWDGVPAPAGSVLCLVAGGTGCPLELGRSGPDGLELRFDATVYSAADAEELAASFVAVLDAALADSSRPLGALSLLDAAAREHVLALGAPGASDPGALGCLHHGFEEQAARTPSSPAVAGPGESLSFAELSQRANQLAHHLIGLGVGPGQPVGLCLRRSPAVLTALLGILKAGGAYLPLNLAHPPARLAHQLAEAGASVVVTEEALLGLGQLPALSLHTVCLDRDASVLAAASAEDPPRRSSLEDLAYVMYTSGSTGLPKGVAVTHRNVANYTAAICARLEVQPGWHFALVSEISTDLGNTCVFPPLLSGGCLHVIDNEMAMDGTALSAYARERPLDVIKITPTHLRALLNADAGFLPRRWLVVGGEALSWELAERVLSSGAGCRLLNHYGPTETTVGCCTYEVLAGDRTPFAATVPIGRPLAGARAFVLDEALAPVPVGVIGELCIGGAGVARGYVNRPDETAERFVDAPGGGRMYRTGDRARFLRDGSIEFLGRVDHQVKIRGFRVEPGEIETALLRHPAVREAAVVAHGEGGDDLRLVAYFVASSGAEPAPGAGGPAPGELQAFLAEYLPDYMVPSRWVPISAFPLTPSGKIDRRALPDPDSVQTQRATAYVAPRDELEQQIAAIWSDLLGVDEVGVMDDFFGLGGHSLLATQAIMRVRRVYGNVPLGAMFTSPTVAALAEVIRARGAA